MSRETRSDLEALLLRLDRARTAGRPIESLESALERRFRPSESLAAYGSLAPGKINHHVVAALDGIWRDGWVHGDLHPEGWGAEHGFPGLRWRPDGPRVAVRVLTSSDLPVAWSRLDAFEGPDYVRILVPVDDQEGRLLTVANLYAPR